MSELLQENGKRLSKIDKLNPSKITDDIQGGKTIRSTKALYSRFRETVIFLIKEGVPQH